VKIVLPGSAIGLLGDGENTRMLGLAACRMGYRVHIYSPAAGPSASLADVSVHAPWEDLDRIRQFAADVAVVTTAEGSLPGITLEAAAGSSALRPSSKTFDAAEDAVESNRESAGSTLLDFVIVAARGVDGALAFYPPIAIDRVNDRVNGASAMDIDTARMPAPMDSRLLRRANGLTRDVLTQIDLTGIGSVEFRLTGEHELVIKEVTPHLSTLGILTMHACVTGQFEQHLRAVCGLPLGSPLMLRPAAIAALTDPGQQDGEPDWAAALAFPGVKLQLSGVHSGNLTATAPSATLARQIVRAARAALSPQNNDCNRLPITL
jgi:phosphoribosylaminoimidazole carboxylase (NCAIR synthetase)